MRSQDDLTFMQCLMMPPSPATPLLVCTRIGRSILDQQNMKNIRLQLLGSRSGKVKTSKEDVPWFFSPT